MLINITITPTAIIIAFAEIRFEIFAATGDAIALPITKPATAPQWRSYGPFDHVGLYRER